MINELFIDCVVKPVLSTSVTLATISVIGYLYEARKNMQEKNEEPIEVSVVKIG